MPTPDYGPAMCTCGRRPQAKPGQPCKPCQESWEAAFPPRRRPASKPELVAVEEPDIDALLEEATAPAPARRRPGRPRGVRALVTALRIPAPPAAHPVAPDHLTGEVVLARRKEIGWTVPALARESGVSPSTIRNVEAGVKVSARTRELLSRALYPAVAA